MAIMLVLPTIFLLAVACAAYMILGLLPYLRRLAMGTALFLAVCSLLAMPSFVGSALLGRLFSRFVGEPMAIGDRTSSGVQSFVYVIASLLAISLATAAAALHGFIVRRVTLPLFRLYVLFVTSGVAALGTICAWIACGGVGYHGPLLWSFVLVPLVMPAFAWHCFRHAAEFRGLRPERLQPVLPEEYGTA